MAQIAQTARAEITDMFRCVQCPILFEDGRVRVYNSPSGEIFVEDTRSGVSMRIKPSHLGGLQFTTDGRVEPIRVTNTIGWRISPR